MFENVENINATKCDLMCINWIVNRNFVLWPCIKVGGKMCWYGIKVGEKICNICITPYDIYIM